MSQASFFPTRICAYILLLPGFCKPAHAFLQKFVYALLRSGKICSRKLLCGKHKCFQYKVK